MVGLKFPMSNVNRTWVLNITMHPTCLKGQFMGHASLCGRHKKAEAHKIWLSLSPLTPRGGSAPRPVDLLRAHAPSHDPTKLEKSSPQVGLGLALNRKFPHVNDPTPQPLHRHGPWAAGYNRHCVTNAFNNIINVIIYHAYLDWIWTMLEGGQ